MTQSTRFALAAVAGAMVFSFSAVASASATDAEAAQKLFKKEDCTKCHAPAKSKKGPSLKKIAADTKGKPDAEAIIIKHMTTPTKVKLDDGTEDDHRVVETKDQAQLKNLAQWILSH